MPLSIPFKPPKFNFGSEIAFRPYIVSKTSDTGEKVAFKRFQSHEDCAAGKYFHKDQWFDYRRPQLLGHSSGTSGVFHHYR